MKTSRYLLASAALCLIATSMPAMADTAAKKIALSNNYAGNSWRQAMLQSWDKITGAAVSGGVVVAADAFTTAEDVALVLSPAQLLANAADVDGDDLTVTNLVASSGTLVDNGDGSWSFTLDNSKPATQALNAGDTIAVTLGYSLVGLLGFRIVWGLIGPKPVRFSN